MKVHYYSSETVAGMLFAAYDDALLDVINRQFLVLIDFSLCDEITSLEVLFF